MDTVQNCGSCAEYTVLHFLQDSMIVHASNYRIYCLYSTAVTQEGSGNGWTNIQLNSKAVYLWFLVDKIELGYVLF
jgi:hypothetical protein